MNNEHVIALVDIDTDRVAHCPVVRQWLWPVRIDQEMWGHNGIARGNTRLLNLRLPHPQCNQGND